MSFRKASAQEFQHQLKDIRSQLVDQIKSLEQRTDVQIMIFGEINDFLKKRSEIDLEYAKQLDKLAKSAMLKHKNERQKRANWPIFSTCTLWQHLVDDTKEEAKQRGIVSEIYGNYVAPSISTRCMAMQKISKKCREIGTLAQGEIVRVLNELLVSMKTYQLCYQQFSALNAKLQQAQAVKKKILETSSSVRKQKSIQKTYDKKNEKFEAARVKCNRSRNEYLLCIDAANAALYKFFADDISDLIDCSDLGMDYWLNLILTNIISARKSVCQTEMNSLANLGSFKDSLQSQVDKQRFFESNNSTFMLPRRFEFKCESDEALVSLFVAEGLSEEFRQRQNQINKRLGTLRIESEASWQAMEETEGHIRGILNAGTLVDVTEYGIADNRPPSESIEQELAKSYESYLQSFSYYLFNANLIMRLEARADGIGNAIVSIPESKHDAKATNGPSEKEESIGPSDPVTETSLQEWQQLDQIRRKKRIGSQASATIVTESAYVGRRRPRLFGGSLEEYVEATGETIPLVVTSCIRVLSQYALHHQGLFRVSGSQLEISNFREAFENGDDPLKDVRDASDVNSIAGCLKLYLRELREPLFPFYLFDLLTDCAKCSSSGDFVVKIVPLLNRLPPSTYLLLRYLFAFLNHLSDFSDENMMDPYNLAICFGPTLLPIPEGKDQVSYQNSVNEVVKNLIVYSESVFVAAKISGPRYDRYSNIALIDTPVDNSNGTTDLDLFDTAGDCDGSFAGVETGSSHVDDSLKSKDFPPRLFTYENDQQMIAENPCNSIDAFSVPVRQRQQFATFDPTSEVDTSICSANATILTGGKESQQQFPALSNKLTSPLRVAANLKANASVNIHPLPFAGGYEALRERVPAVQMGNANYCYSSSESGIDNNGIEINNGTGNNDTSAIIIPSRNLRQASALTSPNRPQNWVSSRDCGGYAQVVMSPRNASMASAPSPALIAHNQLFTSSSSARDVAVDGFRKAVKSPPSALDSLYASINRAERIRVPVVPKPMSRTISESIAGDFPLFASPQQSPSSLANAMSSSVVVSPPPYGIHQRAPLQMPSIISPTSKRRVSDTSFSSRPSLHSPSVVVAAVSVSSATGPSSRSTGTVGFSSRDAKTTIESDLKTHGTGPSSTSSTAQSSPSRRGINPFAREFSETEVPSQNRSSAGFNAQSNGRLQPKNDNKNNVGDSGDSSSPEERNRDRFL